MTDIIMEQHADILQIIKHLSKTSWGRFSRVRVTNFGGVTVDENGARFSGKPTVTEINVGEIERKEPPLSLPALQAEADHKLAKVRPKPPRRRK